MLQPSSLQVASSFPSPICGAQLFGDALMHLSMPMPDWETFGVLFVPDRHFLFGRQSHIRAHVIYPLVTRTFQLSMARTCMYSTSSLPPLL